MKNKLLSKIKNYFKNINFYFYFSIIILLLIIYVDYYYKKIVIEKYDDNHKYIDFKEFIKNRPS